MNLFDYIKKMITSELKGKCDDNSIIELVNKFDLDKFNKDFLLLNNSQLNVIVKEDLLYIEYSNSDKKYYFYTEHKNYSIEKDKIDSSIFSDNNLIQMDKRVIVNMSKIKKYHSYSGILYFDEDIKNSRNIKVSIESIKEAVKYLGRENDLNCKSTVEYSPIHQRKNAHS